MGMRATFTLQSKIFDMINWFGFYSIDSNKR